MAVRTLPLIPWKRYPFARILAMMIPGLLAGQALSRIIPGDQAEWLLGSASFLLLIFLLKIGLDRSFRSLSWLCWFGVSISIGYGERLKDRPKDGIEFNGIAEVAAAPESKPKTFKVLLRHEVGSSNSRTLCKSIAYFQKDSAAGRLLPGDRLYLSMRLRPLESPDLPGQFDYAVFMARKNVLYSAYIRSSDWSGTGAHTGKIGLNRFAAECRSALAQRLDECMPEGKSGIVKAMILGIRSGIDREVRADFAAAGIMHILAVSGLHVSIIWLIVSNLHKPLTRRLRAFRHAGVLIEILAIWSFALLTGFGPSVQRAAFMFSLISLSRITGQQRDIINITAASACVLLLLNPGLLQNAGFQLSYCAVFGILLIFPALHRRFTFRNPVLRYIWSLEAVSFAAVIGTAPVSIYYFQQFPLWFPVTNLIAVPAAFLIVSGAICALTWSLLPVGFNPAAILTGQVSELVIQSAALTNSVDASTIRHIHLERTEALLLGLIILLLIGCVRLPKIRTGLLATALMTTALLFQYRLADKVMEYGTTEMYTTKERSLLIHAGRRETVLPSTDPARAFRFPLDGNHKFDRIRTVDTMVIPEDLRLRLVNSVRTTAP